MNTTTLHDLVLLLNHGLEDTARTDEIAAEVFDNFARTGQWVGAATTAGLTGAVVTYNPATVIEILAVFSDSLYELTRTRVEDLDIQAQWRDEIGSAEAYTVNKEPDLTIRLYPTPDQASYTLTTVYATRRTSFQSWLSPWLALQITAKEFQREGIEQDVAYAQAVAAVADFIAKGLLRMDNAEGPRTGAS